MALIDLKSLTQTFGLENLLDPLREAKIWYEKGFGFPDTVPNGLLFTPRLLQSSTQQLAALLFLLEFTENDRSLFWIAKFYFCLPLAPGWFAARDSLGSEIFKFEDKQTPFHPSISYVLSLTSFQMNKAVAAPYLPRPAIRKNDLHFVKSQAHHATDILLEDLVRRKDVTPKPLRDCKIVGESILEHFLALKDKTTTKTGHLRHQLLFGLLTRRTGPRVNKAGARKVEPFFKAEEGPMINPLFVIRSKMLSNNFMNQNDRGIENVAPLVKRSGKLRPALEINSDSAPVKALMLPQNGGEGKQIRQTPVNRITKVNLVTTKKLRVFLRRDSVERNAIPNTDSMASNKPTNARPKSDFNVRGRSSQLNPRQFYVDICTRLDQAQLKLSTFFNATNSKAMYEVHRGNVSNRVYQPGSTLLSFKLKGK